MGDEQDTKPDPNLEMDVATNTQEISDNMRKMGFDGAADTLHDAAHETAMKAIQDGYVDKPPEDVPLLPGQERIGHGDPQPATTMGEPSGPGPGGPGGPPEWPDYDLPPEPYVPEVVD
jgi:hypothetical protein